MTIEESRESATVVLLRDTDTGPEVLMLQKNTDINYGGSWVFPGGVVDPEDAEVAQTILQDQSREAIAKITAIRETQEETGLRIQHNDLQAFSNWLTPKLRIKRYNALFFVSKLADSHSRSEIVIDEQEIIAAQWIRPSDALAAQKAQTMELNGPSFVTLSQLQNAIHAQHAVKRLVGQGVDYYQPRGCKTSTGVATVYHGDAAYDAPELSESTLNEVCEPLHRLFMHHDRPWEYLDTRPEVTD